MTTVVPDTDDPVVTILRGGGTERAVLRACLRRQYEAVLGPALLAEYEDAPSRAQLFAYPAIRLFLPSSLHSPWVHRLACKGV